MKDHPNYVAIEVERKAIFARLESAQDGLAKAEAGGYLQCLLTPDTELSGDKPVAFNRYRQAGDEKKNWSAVLDAADIQDGVLCQYAVDRYDGPLGSGFILCCQMRDAKGVLWCYMEHYGPEERGEFDRWIEADNGE
jgi:hypothetical protein